MRARITALLSRLWSLGRRGRFHEASRLEFEEHVELLTERYVRSGMSRDAARVAARRQFGNQTLAREAVYKMGGLRWVDSMTQDIRYAARQVWHAPGFSLLVAATLALGIGGATAVFSVLHAVIVAPLPYAQPEQLVRIYQQEPGKADTRHYLTGAHFAFLRAHAKSFESVAALDTYSENGLDLVAPGVAERLRVLPITSDYFATLGSAPLYGPGFTRSDETGTRRVVLSNGVWRSRFGGSEALVGSTVRLNGEPYEVAGIAPEGFDDPIAGEIEAWIPYDLAGDTSEDNNSLTAIGRLRDGVSLEQARSELSSLSGAMKERWPGPRLSAVAGEPLHEDLVAGTRGPLTLLLLAVALVLLVACVNVANLLLARGTGRAHEFATRTALGAGTRRIARQCMVESLLLGTLGGVFGVAIASIGLRVLQRLGRSALPRLDEVGFDAVVLSFAIVVTLATTLTFGLAPALRAGRVPPVQALREQSRSSTSARGLSRIRSGLAAAQLALALTLLVGAGALVASFHRLQQVDLGVRADGVFTFDVNVPTIRYDAARRIAFQDEIARSLSSLPGVTAVGSISFLPTTGEYHGWGTQILTGPRALTSVNRRNGFNIQQRVVSGDLFAALGIPLLAGRTFDERDDARAPLRALTSANFAAAAFPGLPLDHVPGQRIRAGGRTLEIIGVVGNTTVDVYGTPGLVVYHAHRQFAEDRNWALSHVVATSRPPASILPEVRARVATLDPELVIYRSAPMTDVIGRGSSRERFALFLMLTFAGVSLLLAALGLYGVLSFAVRQRVPEIGIRMALGASASQVGALVLRDAAVVVVLGLCAGSAGALVLARWMRSVVFQTSPTDPRLFIAAAVVLSLTALLSSWLPARRAARTPPRNAMA